MYITHGCTTLNGTIFPSLYQRVYEPNIITKKEFYEP